VCVSYLISFRVESLSDPNTSTPYLQCLNIIYLLLALFWFISCFDKRKALNHVKFPYIFHSTVFSLDQLRIICFVEA